MPSSGTLTPTTLAPYNRWARSTGSGGERRIRTSEGESQQIYSLSPLTARESLHGAGHIILLISGADTRTRTANLLITNQLLYQLSYASAEKASQRAERHKEAPGQCPP